MYFEAETLFGSPLNSFAHGEFHAEHIGFERSLGSLHPDGKASPAREAHDSMHSYPACLLSNPGFLIGKTVAAQAAKKNPRRFHS